MSGKNKGTVGLSQAREKLNLTQGQIAKGLNTDQGTISKIEAGKVLGPIFLKYLKFLAEKKVNLNKVIELHEFKP
ncbi:hypothetical protein MTsPCn9_34160 [Croceitalea sp. MTPC9]|uniref:helix-turn-helix domain-containing protein n=1 Tax=unclassified Croceitalea TaxID=2632280 RepID=UPI002B367546|nr:hypothetical protein MTsPCn6_34790 [Croceitalea sp. MTPC6]GMN18476.1 hypothetical protein MTsPCn9_34160 [Croceitalea sp. MTPC9]